MSIISREAVEKAIFYLFMEEPRRGASIEEIGNATGLAPESVQAHMDQWDANWQFLQGVEVSVQYGQKRFRPDGGSIRQHYLEELLRDEESGEIMWDDHLWVSIL